MQRAAEMLAVKELIVKRLLRASMCNGPPVTLEPIRCEHMHRT